MTKMVPQNTAFVLFLALLVFVAAAQSTNVSAAVTDSPPGGPFVDSVVYKVLEDEDQRVLALINNEIDLIGETVDQSLLNQLYDAEDVEVTDGLENGYGYFVIKTDRYPFNITAFRQAFAFALDKKSICDDIKGGLAVPIDSCVPIVNPFSVEGQLVSTYYEANVPLGNQMLDAAGFHDVDSDGWREAPDGSDFDVIVESTVSSEGALEIIEAAAETLRALQIDGISVGPTFEYPYRLYFHGDFDMFFLRARFTGFDVDWLAYEFWSEYADEPYWNLPCWRNATYDSWREQFLYSISYEDVCEAASRMQEIWIHACPGVVCYEDLFFTAYRSDKFEGHANDLAEGTPCWWTNYKVHLKEPEGVLFGGQLRWGTPLDLDTFNFMATSSTYGMDVLGNLYDSLIARDPKGEDIPWLAESYAIEVHGDNPHVTEGHTRFTFNLLQNVTWTDGTPLTAEDVAFTLNYYREGPGNPYGADLSNMTSALVAAPYTVIVEFESESYWHLHTIGYKPIIPRHVFETIGPDGWSAWNPAPDDLVTSGPFVISEYVSGSHTELAYNPDYFHSPDRKAPVLGHPTDLSYIQGSTGNFILWSASDLNPASYTVYANGTMRESGLWTESNMSVNIDGLALGVHNITLCVFDGYQNCACDTVWVTVLPGATAWAWGSGLLSPLSLVITAGSLVVIFIAGRSATRLKLGNAGG